ncbi:MAG: glutamate formimidoyltransferase [Planctomycetes bacterium]|nr:glutamate formimidoyltransferase [Planctomycetota bacterium]MAW77702.1 glutamate formimidoyltransferase [Planctomycetota bacterium]
MSSIVNAEALVECVPNISEGRDRQKIDLIVAAASAVDDVDVLDVDAGADTNRTVITLVGPPDPIAEAAFRLVEKAAELIDMSTHQGAHARHGATDVCPFIPVSGISMEQCIEIARAVGKRIGEELEIPVYMYDRAALREDRMSLADVRRGEYEALAEKMTDEQWKPDFGPAHFLPGPGVVTVGAREFLIAYNVNLNTRDKSQANDLAMEIREKGRAVRINARTPYYSSGQLLRYRSDQGIWPSGITAEVFSSLEELDQHLRTHGTSLEKEADFFGQDVSSLDGEMVMKRGMFQHCRAVGWVIPEYGRAQISINLTDFHVTNMHHVFDACRQLAEDRGLIITGSELVGVAPYPAIRESGEHYLSNQGSSRGIPVKDIIATAVQSLGLSDISDFDPKRSVLGMAATDGPLTRHPVNDFVDEVSRDSPAPGGGSIAALAGSLGAALSSMVANLTFAKRKYRKRQSEMESIAIQAQLLKDDLLRAVDQDTEAFEGVIKAMRLPQSNPEQKQARANAIEVGYRHATEVPLVTAELCLEVMKLALQASQRGLPAGITDAGTATWMARAGLEGAILNVRVNLVEVKDEKWRTAIEEQIQTLQEDSQGLLEQCQQQLEEILGS